MSLSPKETFLICPKSTKKNRAIFLALLSSYTTKQCALIELIENVQFIIKVYRSFQVHLYPIMICLPRIVG